MKWFTYSISSFATAAVATVAVVIGSTIYTLFSLGENSPMGRLSLEQCSWSQLHSRMGEFACK